jgi:hypothetical protein
VMAIRCQKIGISPSKRRATEAGRYRLLLFLGSADQQPVFDLSATSRPAGRTDGIEPTSLPNDPMQLCSRLTVQISP